LTEKVAVAWSGGKDSALALYELLHNPDYEISALLTLFTAGYDRVSLHDVRRTLLEQQVASLGCPLKEVFIPSVPLTKSMNPT